MSGGAGAWVRAALLIAAVAGSSEAQETQEPHKRVLVLHSLGRNFAPFDELATGFQRELRTRAPFPIEFFDASLDSARSPRSTSESAFVDYLTALFRDHPLDLVVTIGGSAARFCVRHRDGLFSSTPLLATGLERRVLEGGFQVTDATSATVVLDLPGQIENILDVLPQTEHIVVITGSAALGKFWQEEARRELGAYGERLRFSWLHELSLGEIVERVVALPPNTAIFYGGLSVDADGVPHERDEALDAIHAAANAPVFGLFDTEMGRGIVGGPLVPISEASRRASEAAVRILNGEAPSDVRVEPVGMGSPVYDYRELVRFGVDERRLPPGSTVAFRPPSAWDQYRGAIVAALAVFSVQAALIVGLLVQRSRRRAAEEQGRGLSRRLLTAHEDERRRLARELHDDLSQRLARLAIDAARVEDCRATTVVDEEAPSVRRELVRLSEDVHALSYRLHPSLIDDLGFREALVSECDRFSRTEGLATHLELDEVSEELSPDAALCLFRVTQEALRNASRHSKATHVRVSLRREKKGVHLLVADDGTGFDSSHRPGRGSLGHASMKERVALARGELEIRSRPGSGTTVAVWLPLSP